MKIKYSILIVLMLLSVTLFSDSGIYMTGGVPITVAGMGGENFNPAYSIGMQGFKMKSTYDFNSEERLQTDVALSLVNRSSIFTIKYEDRFTPRKLARFQWAVPLSEESIIGVGIRNYFSDFNAFTFDAGFLMDKGTYSYGVSVLNIGGLGVPGSFGEDFNRGIFPFVNDPALNYYDEEGDRLKQGMMTHFIFNNQKYYLGIQINNYVSSMEDLKKFGWENIRWGLLYTLTDGSYIGVGQNSRFNSAGAGFKRSGIKADYVFMWRGKSFSYHMITLTVDIGKKKEDNNT